MTETQTQEAPAETQTAPKFKLAPPRGVLKKGVPTDGVWLVAGLPKNGKTTLAASIAGGVVLEMEKGGADRVPGWVQEIPDMNTFRQAFVAACQDQNVKAIVVDTLDVIIDNLQAEVAAKFGLETMSERKEGVNGFAVWDFLHEKVAAMVKAFKECGKLVVLLAHFKEPRLDSEGKLVITNSINAPGKIGGYICSHADVIGICSKKRVGDKTQYVIKFHGEGIIGAFGSRIPELEDKTIVLPKASQWAAIEAAFKPENGKVEAPAAKAAQAKTNGRK